MHPYVRYALIAVLLLLGIAVALFLSKTPSSERVWLPEQSRVVTTDVASSTITLHNVRDWTYGSEEVLSREWTEETIDPADIERVWFFIDYFSPIKGIAHAFLSFELSDGSTIALSVEARREDGEKYSPLSGAFRKYELIYVWSTERDLVARRLVNAKHPVSLYPLTLSKEEAAQLFRLLTDDTHDLATAPRFYNTITGNCMNLLAFLVNRMEPGRLPYHFSWNLPGYAPDYLTDIELIEEGTGVDLTPFRSEVARLATSTPQEFSAGLRELGTE